MINLLLFGWILLIYHEFYLATDRTYIPQLFVLVGAGLLLQRMRLPFQRKLKQYIFRAASIFPVLLVVLMCLHPQDSFLFLVSAMAWYGLGNAVLAMIYGEDLTHLENIVFSMAIGLGLYSQIILGIGLLRGLYSEVLWPLTGALAILGLVRIYTKPPWTGLPWREAGKRMEDRIVSLDSVYFILCLLAGSFFILALVGNFTPPTLSDDLVYHLATPKRFALMHQVARMSDFPLTNLPFSEEMLYLQGMVLGGAYIFTGLMNLLFDFLLLGTFVIVGRRGFHPWSGLLSFLFLFSVPYFVLHLFAGSVDMKYLIYFLLAIFAASNWIKAGRNAWFYLTALMTGLAFNFRYQAVILLALLVVFITGEIFFQPSTRRWPRIIRLGQLIALVAVFAFPWYLKSWIYTGNPLFPLAGHGFNGFYGDAELSKMWGELGNPASPLFYGIFGFGTAWPSFIRLPYRLTFIGGAFDGHSFTPVYLALGATLLFRRNRKLATLSLLFCFLYTAAWFFQIQELKYLIPVFSVLGLLIADGVLNIRTTLQPAFRLFLSVFIIFPTLQSLKVSFVSRDTFLNKLPVAFGRMTPDAYLDRLQPEHQMIRFINDSLGPQDLLFSPAELRLYYLDRPYLFGDPFHEVFVDYRTFGTVENFLARLRELGVTHVLLHAEPEDRVSNLMGPPDAAFMLLSKQLNGPYFQTLHEAAGLRLIKINYPAHLPAYDASKIINPILVGDVLYESGKLDFAAEQYRKARMLGYAGADQKLQRILAMTHLERGDYYMAKCVKFNAFYYLRPAQLEYESAPEVLQSKLESVRQTAMKMVPHIWGRL